MNEIIENGININAIFQDLIKRITTNQTAYSYDIKNLINLNGEVTIVVKYTEVK